MRIFVDDEDYLRCMFIRVVSKPSILKLFQILTIIGKNDIFKVNYNGLVAIGKR